MENFRRGALSFILFALGLLVSLLPMSVHAQLSTGTILGTVKDAQGNAIVGATVTVRTAKAYPAVLPLIQPVPPASRLSRSANTTLP